MTFVFLHGWGYGQKIWDGVRNELPGVATQAPLLRPERPDMAHWADQVSASLPENSLLIGWSLGAMLAHCMANRQPHKFRGLFLIGASPKFVADDSWPHGLDAQTVADFRKAFSLKPERTQKRFLALQTLGDVQRSVLTPPLEQSLLEPSSTNGLDAGLQILEHTDLRHTPLPEGIPCRLLHGLSDALMPVQAAQWLASQRLETQLEVVAGAGHAPRFAEPATLAGQLLEFADAC